MHFTHSPMRRSLRHFLWLSALALLLVALAPQNPTTPIGKPMAPAQPGPQQSHP